jgi:hypothetical protein
MLIIYQIAVFMCYTCGIYDCVVVLYSILSSSTTIYIIYQIAVFMCLYLWYL